MKSFVQSLYLFTSAIGSAISEALVSNFQDEHTCIAASNAMRRLELRIFGENLPRGIAALALLLSLLPLFFETRMLT